MTDTQADTHVNGTAPAPAAPAADQPAEVVSSGEKILAVVAALFGAFIIVMAIDMATGGKIGGWITDRTTAP